MRKEINLKSLTLNDEQVSFEKAHLYLEDAEVDIGDENELISEHYIEWGIEIEQPDRQLDFSKGYSIELEGDDGIHRSGKCVVDSYENIGNRTVNASLYGNGVLKQLQHS